MATDQEIREKVEKEIEKIRPKLQMDGGDVSLVGIEDGVVKLKLEGTCKGCPMSAVTIHMGIEQELKKTVPEIKSVEAVNVNVPPQMMERIRQMQAQTARE